MDFLFCSQSLSHSDFPQRSSAYFEGYFRRVLFGLENSNLSRVSYVLSESYSRSTNKHTSCGGFDFLFSPGQSREDVQFLFSVPNEDLSCCFFGFFFLGVHPKLPNLWENILSKRRLAGLGGKVSHASNPIFFACIFYEFKLTRRGRFPCRGDLIMLRLLFGPGSR